MVARGSSVRSMRLGIVRATPSARIARTMRSNSSRFTMPPTVAPIPRVPCGKGIATRAQVPIHRRTRGRTARPRSTRGAPGMSDFILAIDQGTTGTTVLVLDPRAQVRGRATVAVPQHFPGAGMVEHDGEEIWSTVLEAIRDALESWRGVSAAAMPPSGSPTSARPRCSGTARTGTAHPPRHRVAGPSHGRPLRGPPRPRRGARLRGQDRAPARPLFLRHQDRLDPRPRRGRAGPRRAGRARLRHHRHLAGLTAHRRRARHRRRATPRARCSSTSARSRGTTPSSTPSTCPARCSPRSAPALASSVTPAGCPGCPTAFPSPESQAISRPRSSGSGASPAAM